MIASPGQIAELEQFFQTVSVPPTFRLNAATTIHDLPAFIRRTLDHLKKGSMSDTALQPRYDDLLVIKKLLESAASQ